MSIISDYNLKTGLCELVDNPLVQWPDRNFSGELTVEVSLDVERQLITVRDNAGEVSRDDLMGCLGAFRLEKSVVTDLNGFVV